LRDKVIVQQLLACEKNSYPSNRVIFIKVLAWAGNRETYVLMGDYKNGCFIHIKKIPQPVE
jgi:hypothetical protein